MLLLPFPSSGQGRTSFHYTVRLPAFDSSTCCGPGRLTAEARLGHGVGAVVEPLGRVRANVGLRGSVRHRIVADPGGQVDVERPGVDDPVRIHKPLTSQLQNPERGWISDGHVITNGDEEVSFCCVLLKKFKQILVCMWIKSAHSHLWSGPHLKMK